MTAVRTGIVISTYNRSAGLERVSGEWARGLASRGHDVSVFAQRAERGPGDESIRFVPVGGLRGPIAARAATFPPAATRAVRKHQLDAVVSFGCTVLDPAVVRLPGAHAPWWELANREAPAVSAEGFRRRLNPHHAITLAFERRIIGNGVAQKVLTASEAAAADVRRFYPRSSDRIEIVPDGIDLDEFRFDSEARTALRERWGADGSWVVLTVATEVRRKGIATLLRAFKMVLARRPKALLVVAGTADRAAIARLAAAEGLGDRVRVAGFVPDIRAAYSAADLLVFPTLFDPWGLPVVEALACGTPVAASVAAGASSAVKPGVTGVLIEEPRNPAAVAAAMGEAGNLVVTRGECQASVEYLAWPRIVDMVERILDEVVAR